MIATTLSQHDLQFALLRAPKRLLEVMKNPIFRNRIFVAGGFLRAVIAREEVNDVDVFVSDNDTHRALINCLIAKKSNVVGGDDWQDSRFHCIETENATTITGFNPTVQVIKRWRFSGPVSCIDSFDFTVCSAAFYHDGDKWQSVCDPSFYGDLAAKRLVYRAPERDEEPGGSALRLLKYYQRGYRTPIASYARLLARLVKGINASLYVDSEAVLAAEIQKRLREVDPSVDPKHIAHLPEIDRNIALPAEALKGGNSGGL